MNANQQHLAFVVSGDRRRTDVLAEAESPEAAVLAAETVAGECHMFGRPIFITRLRLDGSVAWVVEHQVEHLPGGGPDAVRLRYVGATTTQGTEVEL